MFFQTLQGVLAFPSLRKNIKKSAVIKINNGMRLNFVTL